MLRILVAAIIFFNYGLSHAQTPVPPVNTPLNFTQITSGLEKLRASLNSGRTTSKETGDILQQLNQTQSDINQARSSLAASLESVNKRINALGPLPENSAKEPAAIAAQRRQFDKEADSYKAQIAQADLIKTQIDELNSLILKIRNQELLNNILVRQSSIFHPQEFWDSLTSFSDFVFDLLRSPLKWYQNLPSARKTAVKNNLLIVFLIMGTALIAAVYLSSYIRKWFGYRSSVEKPNYTQKVRAAVWMMIARGVIPAAVIGAFLVWLANTPLIGQDSFGLILRGTALYFLYYFLARAVVKVIFAPADGRWRILEMADDKARAVSSTLIISAAAVCIVSFLQQLAHWTNYDSSVIYSLKIFSNAVKTFCIIWIAKRFLYDEYAPLPPKDNTPASNPHNPDGEITELSPLSKLGLFIIFFIGAAFILSLFGYIRLSEFIINRFIVSVVVIGGYYIIDKLLRVLFHQLLLLRFWVRVFRINRRSLVKTELWFGLFLTPLIWIMAALTLLAVWGVSVDILMNNVKNFLIGFNIGGIHISITSIILGIISFFIILSLFRMLKNSFVTGSLSKLDLDNGVRNSIISGIGFIGYIIAGLLAIAVMGGSIGSIAIIAGALSFGVGLGLQNMVSNLAAGMTILWERPIKIGDWVIIDGQEGIVKQINMRSTELETWNKSTVIIPNSDILSKSLTNLTYSGKMGRVEIKVGVSYDSDVDLVTQTLIEIALSVPDVLSTPAPSVTFNDLADNSLNFQLNCFTANIFNRAAISNAIRRQIINRFRELKINIPFPQRDVYLYNQKS